MWRKFQESTGRRTFFVSSPSPLIPLPKGEGEIEFQASIVEHKLPIVGKYFYIPRGPIIREQESVNKEQYFGKIINLAKENNIGWIRIDPENSFMLDIIRSNWRVFKSPHDMQPRENFVMDISKTEEELLAGMKEKTRYNIKLAQKRGVVAKIITNNQETINKQISNSNGQNFKKYASEFIELIKITSERKGIKSHPESYYQKMLETIPAENLKLYLAEYQNKIIAGILVIYFGKTATYLHGASSDEFRNVMAPYLLQWQAIQNAKKEGMTEYDFGGISTNYELNTNIRTTNSWAGITKFKTGFSPETNPTEFPGSYDIVINPFKYALYRALQKIKSLI